MFGRIGVQEILLVLAVLLLIFGPKRLPEFGRSIGKALREFRSASKDFQKSLEGAAGDDEEEDEEEKTKDKEKKEESSN